MCVFRVELALALAVSVLAWGCAPGRSTCLTGSQGCACTPNGGCDSGLSCSNERVCSAPDVRAPMPSPAPGPGGGGSGGGGSDGGGSGSGGSGGEPPGDEPGGDDPPADPPEACTVDLGAGASGDYYIEPLLGDWPDCISGCAHRYTQRQLYVEVLDGGRVSVFGEVYDGLKGTIDGEVHEPGGEADIDKIFVFGSPGSLVQVDVQAFRDPSCIDPLVATFDGNLITPPLYGTLTQNDAAAAGTARARTVIAMPEDGVFVDVYDAVNVAFEAPVAGGDGFEYVVRLQDLGPVSFLTLDWDPSTQTGTRSDLELERAGDLHYFRFEDSARRGHVVRFETDNPSFCGHIWQVDPVSFEWTGRGSTAGFDSSVDCAASVEFVTSEFAAGDGDDYAFVVTDALGRGSNSGAGEFVYRVLVSPTF